MADKTLTDVREFLGDLVADLTGMHVKAMQYSLAPTDQDAVDALAKVPAGLIDRAQALAAGLDKQQPAERADGEAKAPAKKPARRSR